MIRSAVLTQITCVTSNSDGPDSDGPDFDGPGFDGSLIETYKILTEKYDMAAVPSLSIATTVITRGNDLRLQKNPTRYDLRKFFFTNSVVNMWNSLPNSVVHAEFTDIF